ncbi:hypothetical protein D9M68_942900 [compost metagenome]
MPRPVGTGSAQLFGECRVVAGDDVRGLAKEAPHYHPQPGAGDVSDAVLLQAGDQGCPGVPTGWCHRQSALYKMLIECGSRKWR